MTTLQGHLQDAFRNGRRIRVAMLALLLRALLSRLGWWVLRWQAQSVRVDDADGFATFIAAQIEHIRRALDQKGLSGEQFHELRKIVSRYVSFVDTLRTIRPSDELIDMSRVLSATNGLMGALHDDLIEAHAKGLGNYRRDIFHIPPDIVYRLRKLLSLFPERGRS